MNTQEALLQVFQHTNTELSDRLKVNYNTVTSWRYKFRNNQLSLEKQIEILTKLNYKPKSNLLWSK